MHAYTHIHTHTHTHIHTHTQDGYSAIDIAACSGHEDVAELLLDLKADCKIQAVEHIPVMETIIHLSVLVDVPRRCRDLFCTHK